MSLKGWWIQPGRLCEDSCIEFPYKQYGNFFNQKYNIDCRQINLSNLILILKHLTWELNIVPNIHQTYMS